MRLRKMYRSGYSYNSESESFLNQDEDYSTTSLETTFIPTTTPSSSSKDEDGEGNKWLVPVLIGVGVVIIVIGASIVIYRKWRCFGFLPRKNLKFAQPVRRRLSSKGSLASSLSSTLSSIAGGIGGGQRKYRKYAVRCGEDLSVRNIWGEFEALKRETPQDVPTSVALRPENIVKNRFSNVLPYDRNRVLLEKGEEDGDEGSLEGGGRKTNDYINASYLSGFRGEKAFISTQGPRSNTIDDFWRMCWETKASSIVMLTKCYENDKEKCYPYWPSNILSPTLNTLSSEITVRLENVAGYQYQGKRKDENESDGNSRDKDTHCWLISELSMEKGDETRKILHFYYLSWPDFGVVDPPAGLLCFLSHFRKISKNHEGNENGGPTIVHCSAGVGRTGVFIAVDSLFQRLRGSNDASTVNIFQIVQKMRTERMGMVQTPDQYKLIYDCLAELWRKDKDDNFVPISEPTQVSPDLISTWEESTILQENSLS